MEDLEGGPEELKGFIAPWEEQRLQTPRHPKTPPGTEPSTKGYTWFHPKMWQRKALLGISRRSDPWTGKGSIDVSLTVFFFAAYI